MSFDSKDDHGKNPGLLEKGEEFLEMFRKGQEFTQELLRDNERLRFRVIQLEESLKEKLQDPDSGTSGPEVEKVTDQLVHYEERLKDLEEKLFKVESENMDFAKRYVDVEEQNNNLANLYVASYQLHSTLDYQDVLQIILEIMINLIGAEVFCIYLLDKKAKTLTPEAAEGISPADIPPAVMGEGSIGRTAQLSRSYFNENPSDDLKDRLSDPLVCIPLTIKEDVIGVIALFRLLQQKTSFGPVDFELFTLLAGHAATAIFSSRLFSESRRKLSTYQGFLDLLTQ